MHLQCNVLDVKQSNAWRIEAVTKTLSDPYAQHVQLQKTSVHSTAGRVVHKRVVDERADPWTQDAQKVSVRENGYVDLTPW